MPFYTVRLIERVINIPCRGAKLRSGRAVTVVLFLKAIENDEFAGDTLHMHAFDRNAPIFR